MLAPAILLAAAVSAPALSPPPSADAEALRALGMITAGGPGISEVQAAAARAVERDGAAVDGFPRRSRLAGLLPRLTAEVRYDERSNRVVGLQGSGEVDYLRLAPGRAFLVRATWDLGALVAARGELAAASAAEARARRRDDAVKRATSLFYERRRAMLALLLEPPAGALARAEAELAVDRLTAELDAVTGGLLSGGAR
jgi:hypothetical protein